MAEVCPKYGRVVERRDRRTNSAAEDNQIANNLLACVFNKKFLLKIC